VRREEKRTKERDVGVFYIREREKKKKRRHVCCEMRDFSFLIKAFYRRVY
jgi:hypothetical protein